MVVMEQRRAMAKFVTALVETAGRYDICVQKDDHIAVAQKQEFARDPAHPIQIYIALLAGNRTLADYNRLVESNRLQGVYTANVLYKDGETYMVRLGARGRIKGDDRSLKLYTQTEIDKMIHLRDLEARLLELEHPADTLTYYQPETARLSESLRGYQMRPVTLDYTHIRPGDKGYGFRRGEMTAVDYRLAEEVYQRAGSDKIMFKGTESREKVLNIVLPPVPIAQTPEQGPPQTPANYRGTGAQLSLFSRT